jgi:hypothetical protein
MSCLALAKGAKCREESELSEERVPRRGVDSLSSLTSQRHLRERQEVELLLAAAERVLLSPDAVAGEAEVMLRGEQP